MFRFLTGLLLGSAIGAFAMKYYLDNKYDAEYFDEEVEVNNPEKKPKKEEPPKRKKSEEYKERLNKVLKTEHPVDSDEDEDEMDSETSKRYHEGLDLTQEYHKNKNKKPRIISVNELSDLPQTVDEVELAYYTESCVLVDAENLEPIDNVEFFIGDALTKYGFADNSESYIYVMNYALNTVYQILKIRGEFNVNGGAE